MCHSEKQPQPKEIAWPIFGDGAVTEKETPSLRNTPPEKIQEFVKNMRDEVLKAHDIVIDPAISELKF